MMSQVNDDWDELDANGQPVTPNWDRTRTFAQDRFGNVIAVTDNGLDEYRRVVRISYDQLGYPNLDSEYRGADFDENGGIDQGDLDKFFEVFEAGSPVADLDANGGIDGNDLSKFFIWFEAGYEGDHDLNDQRFLYRGYWWDQKLEMYHVRHRVYDPRRMIWLQRDPLGQLAGPDEYAYVMGEPRDYYDPMGLDKWDVSEPFYYLGLDGAGEYVNDLIDGAMEWTDRTTGEAAKEDAKWHQVIDEQQDQVDCKLHELVQSGKMSEEEAARQGFLFHMQQDGDQRDVEQWSRYSEETADQLTQEVALTIVTAGVGNLAGRGLGIVGKWVFNSAAGRLASRWAARTSVSRATQWLAYWGNKPINSQFFKQALSASQGIDDAVRAGAGQLDEAYHYTSSEWAESIGQDGLRPGSYATPNGGLSGLQAQLELAMNPTRAAPNMRIRINLEAMREAGYKIPTPSRVSSVIVDRSTGRVYNMPGGGYEIQFPYRVPSKYLEIPGQ